MPPWLLLEIKPIYTIPENINVSEVKRKEKKFCSGSTYEGSWNILGMNGFGFYSSPTGTVYMGRISDGEFHGRGEMAFPSGDTVQGRWEKGQLKNGELFYNNGLQFESENWPYCRMPDRRFFIEIESSIQPVNDSYKTAEQPTKIIPNGYYDTGDGFYDPVTKVIYKYENQAEVMRSPFDDETKWIMNNCRRAPDGVVGPQPELYKTFYEPFKYLDKDCSELEEDCDEIFQKHVKAMKEKITKCIHLNDPNQSMIKSRFVNDQSKSLITSTTNVGPTNDTIGIPRIYDKRTKLFI